MYRGNPWEPWRAHAKLKTNETEPVGVHGWKLLYGDILEKERG
jgi:hypothetical protein